MRIDMLNIPIEVNIPMERVKNLLITAMEQSCGYWTRVTWESASLPSFDDYDKVLVDAGYIEFGILNDDGTLSDERKKLTYDRIKIGLELMAEKWPRHFGDFLTGQGDIFTADVFLQCCLLGDIVYG